LHLDWNSGLITQEANPLTKSSWRTTNPTFATGSGTCLLQPKPETPAPLPVSALFSKLVGIVESCHSIFFFFFDIDTSQGRLRSMDQDFTVGRHETTR